MIYCMYVDPSFASYIRLSVFKDLRDDTGSNCEGMVRIELCGVRILWEYLLVLPPSRRVKLEERRSGFGDQENKQMSLTEFQPQQPRRGSSRTPSRRCHRA